MKYQRLYSIIFSWALTSCSGEAEVPLDSSTPSITPTQVEEQNSCVDIGGLFECSVEHQNEKRTFKIYEPNSVDGGNKLPLLINFHGFGGNADEQLSYGDFRSLSEQEGFLLVVPQGSLTVEGDAHWNSELSPESKSSADDQGFVVKMLETLSETYEIDDERVYAVGMSNGGAMSLYLACSLSQIFKAVASVTGFMSANLRERCEANKPTSVILIHGTADKVVSWDSGLGDGSILSIAEFWAAHNRCSEFSASEFEDHNGDGVSGVLHKYTGCDAGTFVEVYEVTDMGHVWPEKRRGDDINAAEIVWEFFSRGS